MSWASAYTGARAPFARKQAEGVSNRSSSTTRSAAVSTRAAASEVARDGLRTLGGAAPSATAAVTSSRALPGRPSRPMQSLASLLPRARAMPSLFVAATIATTVLFAGVGSAFSTNGNSADSVEPSKNVLGQDLEICSTDPLTGYFRCGNWHRSPTCMGVHAGDLLACLLEAGRGCGDAGVLRIKGVCFCP
jgi:hypothetical protein